METQRAELSDFQIRTYLKKPSGCACSSSSNYWGCSCNRARASIRISVELTERTAWPWVGVWSMFHQESSSSNHISQALVFSEMKFANGNFEYTLKFTLWPRSCATILILSMVALYTHECKTTIEKKCELFTVSMVILKLNNFQVLFYSKHSFSMIKNGLFVFH